MPNGQCRFNARNFANILKKQPDYKIWLSFGKDESHAKCSICNTDINIRSSIASGLKSHTQYSTHKTNVAFKIKSIKNMQPLHFLNSASTGNSTHATSSAANSTHATSSAANSTHATSAANSTHATSSAANSTHATSSAANSTLDASLMHQIDVSKAEILWTFKCTESHMSFRSCLGLNEL